jgi:hypothetical protein
MHLKNDRERSYFQVHAGKLIIVILWFNKMEKAIYTKQGQF